MLIIEHFVSRKQIEELRRIFTRPTQVKVFDWPTADPNEVIREELDFTTAPFIELLERTCKE